jgi:hypothetical protein
MGQLANFSEISPEMFEEILADADSDMSECPGHSLDRAWDALRDSTMTWMPFTRTSRSRTAGGV